MSPIVHILLTGILFAPLCPFFAFPFAVLAWAVFFTVAIDVFDHGLAILAVQSPLYSKVRELLRQRNVSGAYAFYYENRYHSNYLIFHNVFGIVLFAALSYILQSPALAIGVVFHLLCDFALVIYRGQTSLLYRRGEFMGSTV